MTRFLIVDDHPLFREALGNAVRLAYADAEIFETMSIDGALDVLSEKTGIDLALLDLSLPGVTGFAGFMRLRVAYPRLPVAIVSSHEDQRIIREALSLGASGYLPKSTSKRELAAAIKEVLSGSISVPKDFVATSEIADAESSAQALRARICELTPQQLRVLDLIRRGLQNKHIAIELEVAESTVKAHVTEILRKLKIYSRTKAVIAIGNLDFTDLNGRRRGA